MNGWDREATRGNAKASRVREAIDNLNASNFGTTRWTFIVYSFYMDERWTRPARSFS